jgi:hypothetical protein
MALLRLALLRLALLRLALLRLALLRLALAASVGCGASMEAVYESDVRFEHCMALDARPDVKPAMRRACWREWVSHYNYGQTRDRIDHARQRVAELGDGGAQRLRDPATDPSTAYDLRDPHTPIGGSDARGSLDAIPSELQAICAGTCEAVRSDCSEACGGGACQRNCALGFQRCMLSCG